MGITTEYQIRRGLKAISEHRFALAVDLAQAQDFTAIAILERTITWHVEYKGRETRIGDTYDLKFLMRLARGMSYVEQVREVAQLLGQAPLSSDCLFGIDQTGVGAPVGDLFNEVGLRPYRITITGGERQSSHGPRRWHVPKQLLISALDARLHTGELRIAQALPEADTLRTELRDFRRHVSTAGRFSYEARTGCNDDLVLSLAIALWLHVGLPKPQVPFIGTASFVGKERK